MTDATLEELVERVFTEYHNQHYSHFELLPSEAIKCCLKVVEEYKAEREARTITLCGSTRFKEVFNEVSLELCLADWKVLSVGCFLHSDEELKERITDEVKIKLDKLHKSKIDDSFAIVVLNKDSYIGSSTKSEIDYARAHGKKIYWYFDSPEFQDYDRDYQTELNWVVLLKGKESEK